MRVRISDFKSSVLRIYVLLYHEGAIGERGPENAKKILGYTEMKGACFVAGTLVHTKEGMKPIEQIRVGDYVLSKPENGKGEVAYKRVVRTVKRNDCETWFVSWSGLDMHEAARAKRITQREHLAAHDDGFVSTTPNHPFCVAESGKEERFHADDRILEACKNRSWPCGEWVRSDFPAPGMKPTPHDGSMSFPAVFRKPRSSAPIEGSSSH
jgi:hypothetical protein